MKNKESIARILPALILAVALSACGNKPDVAEGKAPDANSEGEAAPQAESGHTDEHGEDEASHEEGPPSTTIPASNAQSSGIRVAAAAAGTIADEHEVQGLLTPVEGRVAQVTARFPGPVRSVRANIGDAVRAGQALATIESNLSLTTYTVSSPIAGVVLQRSTSVGMAAGEGAALYEVADLSKLWVDLHIFGADAGHITAGIPVTVTRMSDGVSAETTLERILPATATASQSTVARATIDNGDGLWRPGAAVRARITVDRADAALVVPLTALQTDEANRDVVYVRQGERYSERAVKLGRRDAQRAEVLAGLRAGEQVVVAQSFLVKADIGKSSAEHDH
ncbi:MAG TPA: efflux RND transporter periplasmic adaptor subunit [Luteimonas sp.]|nr:efflux RND transporter periplasmic adaptor subunit [Luteimonas sp.]